MFAWVKNVRERSNDRPAGVRGLRASRLCQKAKKRKKTDCSAVYFDTNSSSETAQRFRTLKYNLCVKEKIDGVNVLRSLSQVGETIYSST